MNELLLVTEVYVGFSIFYLTQCSMITAFLPCKGLTAGDVTGKKTAFDIRLMILIDGRREVGAVVIGMLSQNLEVTPGNIINQKLHVITMVRRAGDIREVKGRPLRTVVILLEICTNLRVSRMLLGGVMKGMIMGGGKEVMIDIIKMTCAVRREGLSAL